MIDIVLLQRMKRLAETDSNMRDFLEKAEVYYYLTTNEPPIKNPTEEQYRAMNERYGL
jgi:hypothetical protein